MELLDSVHYQNTTLLEAAEGPMFGSREVRWWKMILLSTLISDWGWQQSNRPPSSSIKLHIHHPVHWSSNTQANSYSILIVGRTSPAKTNIICALSWSTMLSLWEKYISVLVAMLIFGAYPWLLKHLLTGSALCWEGGQNSAEPSCHMFSSTLSLSSMTCWSGSQTLRLVPPIFSAG